jgi:hypothetical protein
MEVHHIVELVGKGRVCAAARIIIIIIVVVVVVGAGGVGVDPSEKQLSTKLQYPAEPQVLFHPSSPRDTSS